METYKSYYSAKAAREAKERPADWLLIPNERYGYQLVCLK